MRDPNNTRDTKPRTGSPLWAYLTLITLAGVTVLACAPLQLSPGDATVLSNPVFWLLGCFVVFGECRPIITPGLDENSGSTSTTFSFAALLYFGLLPAVVLQVVGVLAAGLLLRRAPHRTAFNAAQFTLSLGAAALVLDAAGIRPQPLHPWLPGGSDLALIVAAALAYFLVNQLTVASAVALHERVPIGKALRVDLASQTLVQLALLGLSPLIVVAMDRSAAFIPLIVLPFVAVYLNASGSVRREHQALHDGLTGLPNRKLLIMRSEEALAEARGDRDGADRVGLFLLDLDRFKEVNDTLGHPTGDRLLQIVAHRLTHSVRPGDLVARLGGDEFAILLPTVRDAQAAREVAARLRAALSEPVRLDGLSFDLEASVGIALHPDHAPDFELLLQRADVAMYVAKESRRGVEVYSPARDRNSPARLGMLGDLRRAIDREELELYYQPKVDLAVGAVIGVEALLRWRHPKHGLIGPEEFLPVAEQTYLMRAITQHVVGKALEQAAQWWREGLHIQVSVNTSGRDLLDGGLVETIATGLAAHALPTDALQLEITERILMNEPAYAGDTVAALARLGVPLSLDDFGTGYSSLVRLRRLPVQEIKIDSSFVRRLGDPLDEDRVIVQSVVDLARTLGLRSVAEGVESAEIARELREMGCDAAQGWHLARPMSAALITPWLHDNPRVEPDPAPAIESKFLA